MMKKRARSCSGKMRKPFDNFSQARHMNPDIVSSFTHGRAPFSAWRLLPRTALLLACAAVLAACASGPRDNITLIPADQIAQESSKEGLFTQPLKYKHTKPGCKGECPNIEVDSLVFPGVPILTELVDHALTVMTGVGSDSPQPYATLQQYEDHFWQTAAPRDSTMFSAKARYRNRHLTVIELNTWQYFTGAAHGISATQFLNWDNSSGKVLGMADILQPGAHNRYEQALRAAHARWLADNPDAQRDPQAYDKLWPFQPSENFALTDAGMVIKYDSYQLAPYSHGQPELAIPYSELQGILKPEYLPS